MNGTLNRQKVLLATRGRGAIDRVARSRFAFPGDQIGRHDA
ncbi:MAG: hypothetical protein NZ739_09460 [Verrucomicrobiae bacterium]|nr:hypothetical protein [Verrucomicrobiae bacterium]